MRIDEPASPYPLEKGEHRQRASNHQAAMGAPSTSTSPLSRLLLSLPKPGAARHPRASPAAPCPDDARSSGAGHVLRRREAAAAVVSAAVLSRFLPPLPAVAEAADGGECPLEVAPSGLAFCDRVVGTGAAAQQGQLIQVSAVRLQGFIMSCDRTPPIVDEMMQHPNH